MTITRKPEDVHGYDQHQDPLRNGCEPVPVDLLTRGMVLMESPERSIGTVERVVPSMGWVHVELLDGGSERYDAAATVLVRTPADALPGTRKGSEDA